MNHSPTIAKLAEALAKAQPHYGKARKDADNPFFRSKYVDLAGCYEACRAALCAQGLAVVQTTELSDAGAIRLVTTLIHSSGEWLGGVYPVKPVKEDPQGLGSAMTYARRYALMALVGLAAEDDDGEAASGRGEKAAKVASVTGEVVSKIPPWTDEARLEVGAIFKEIYDLGGKRGEADVADLRKRMKYDAASDVIDAAGVLLRKWQDIAHSTTEEGQP